MWCLAPVSVIRCHSSFCLSVPSIAAHSKSPVTWNPRGPFHSRAYLTFRQLIEFSRLAVALKSPNLPPAFLAVSLICFAGSAVAPQLHGSGIPRDSPLSPVYTLSRLTTFITTALWGKFSASLGNYVLSMAQASCYLIQFYFTALQVVDNWQRCRIILVYRHANESGWGRDNPPPKGKTKPFCLHFRIHVNIPNL